MAERDPFARPYLLLTPGPLSTSRAVREAMGRDWCTWDEEYNVGVVHDIRHRLVALGDPGGSGAFTAVLMQGSGTASVEATIGTAMAPTDRLLVLANGHYGERIGRIATVLGIDHEVVDSGELGVVDPSDLDRRLQRDPSLTHVAMVHCETTTGRLNPLADVAGVVAAHERTFVVDAMSSFGGVPIDMDALGITYLVSSANKCIQGVPGFGFVLARRDAISECEGRARSLSLDLFDQWRTMETQSGKWRFTSPTHTVRAFHQALIELDAEGGIAARHDRYVANQRTLVAAMAGLGFDTLVPAADQSPFITGFALPAGMAFDALYRFLKAAGFVIYPGKVTDIDSFRIGTIGDVYPADIERLVHQIGRFVDTTASPGSPTPQP